GALLVQTAGFIRSTEVALTTWIDDKIAADLFVLSGGSLNSAGLPMREDVAERLRADPRVQTVLPVRGHQLLYNDRIVFLLAGDAEALLRAQPNIPPPPTFPHHPPPPPPPPTP